MFEALDDFLSFSFLAFDAGNRADGYALSSPYGADNATAPIQAASVFEDHGIYGIGGQSGGLRLYGADCRDWR